MRMLVLVLSRPARSLLIGWLAALACVAVNAGELRLAIARGPVSLPLYVAHAKGFFAAEALSVRLLACSSGRDCFQLVEADQADVATSAELIVTLDSMRKATTSIIASISSSAQHIRLVARRSAGIHKPTDLEGKRVGTVAKTSAQYFLDNWLLYHDIDAGRVEVVPFAVNELVNALAERRVDAIAIWQPTAQDAAAQLGADLSDLGTPRVYTQHFVLAMNKRRLEERKSDVKKLLRAVLRAEELIRDQPHEAANILADKLSMDRMTARTAMGEHDYRLSLTPTLLSTMDSQARWAIHQGMVTATSGSGAVQQAVDSSALRSVAPGTVSLPGR